MPIVSGRVVFDANRSATIDAGDSGLANIPVVLQDVNTGNRLVVLTDSNGTYTFNNVPNGSYRIVEAYGTTGGTPTPGNFLTASVGAIPTGADPPITSASNPPAGATNLDSLSPNTLFVTVAGSDLSNENFLDGPVIYTDIGQILDSCVVVGSNNLITAANNGTFGSEPAGSAINTAPVINPYPGLAPGFTYTTPAPPATRPIDGTYTIQNISGLMAINNGAWWRIADHTTGNETGRFQAIGGASPGAVFFQQTINVTPNTDYLFSAWILNLIKISGLADPKLGVEILDQGGNILYQQTLGNSIPTSLLAPEWKEIGTTLNSQGNSQLTVKFTSEGPAATGNDYAIDDIAFSPITIPTFTPVKSASRSIADIGETVTYTITLTNTCESDLTNVTFQDTVPNGLTFVPGTVSINGVTNAALDPNAGFTIPNISGLNTAVVTFSAVVNSIPTTNPTNNIANMTYEYTPIVGGIPNQSNKSTNAATVLVNHAELTPTKAVDLSIAGIGDELTYTISFTNTGNVNAENVVLTDQVPNGTSYVAGSLTSNVAVTGSPTSTISLVNPVAPGGTVNIRFRVKVNSIPNPNPIPNTGSLNYQYTVDPANPKVQKNINTNTVTTQVNSALITPTKSTGALYANVGDTVTHTVSFTNNGNQNATNVKITDLIPNGTSLVPGSLNVNATYTGDLTNGIVLTNPVAPGASVIISYELLVNSIPNPNPFQNTATVNYDYIVDPANPPVSKSINSNTTTTQVNHAQIDPPVKIGTPSGVVQVGDIISYSITFTNTGNVNAQNVVITDPIRPGTSLVANSLNVNVPYTGNLNSGIALTNPVAPGETIVVNYKLLVEEIPSPNPIQNTATITYGYVVNPSEPLVPGTVDSNTVSILVNPVSISKTCTPSKVSLTETITYNFTITNTSLVDITNVTFFDTLPSGVTFVNGSFVGSTNPNVIASNLLTGVPLGTIVAGGSAKPSFKVTVTNIPCPLEFPNTARITYNAIFQTGVTSTVTSTSNTCTVDYKTLGFLQCFKDGILTIPSQKPDVESVISVDVTLLFQDYEVIDSPIGTSVSKQNLTGKKLLIHFKLCIVATYVATDPQQSVHTAEYEVEKCEYIVLPNILDYNCLINLTHQVEDVFYSKLSNRNIFYNVTYIVESGI